MCVCECVCVCVYVVYVCLMQGLFLKRLGCGRRLEGHTIGWRETAHGYGTYILPQVSKIFVLLSHFSCSSFTTQLCPSCLYSDYLFLPQTAVCPTG